MRDAGVETAARTEQEAGEAGEAAKMRGAEILVRGLIRNGVDKIFGLPGGAVLHIYDELWRFRDEITHYLVRHEQGAVDAAEGYAGQRERSAWRLLLRGRVRPMR